MHSYTVRISIVDYKGHVLLDNYNGRVNFTEMTLCQHPIHKMAYSSFTDFEIKNVEDIIKVKHS